MNNYQASQLKPGLYLIEWKQSQGGGSSLASVGVCCDGSRWLAPINWVTPTTDRNILKKVARAVEITNNA